MHEYLVDLYISLRETGNSLRIQRVNEGRTTSQNLIGHMSEWEEEDWNFVINNVNIRFSATYNCIGPLGALMVIIMRQMHQLSILQLQVHLVINNTLLYSRLIFSLRPSLSTLMSMPIGHHQRASRVHDWTSMHST